MDSLTQMALGASVGGAVAGRKIGRKSLLIGAVLGSVPDLDVLVPFNGAVETFTYHRSFSHSVIVLTLLTPIFAWLLHRWTFARELTLTRCTLLVWLALMTHTLLDAFTVYGTQLFWPLTNNPVSGSSVFIIDPAYTVILLVGLATMLRRPLVGVRWNRLFLFVSCLYLCWSLVAKHQISKSVTQSLETQGVSYTQLLVTPLPFNTIGWRFVAMQSGGYVSGYASLLDPPGTKLQTIHGTSSENLLDDITDHWPVDRLRTFTHGFYKVHRTDDEVIMTDLRMGVEGAYIFAFVVGEMAGETVVPVKSREAETSRDFSAFGTLMKRIVDPSILIPTNNSD